MIATVTKTNGTIYALFNVTEVHYNFDDGDGVRDSVAFESDIHSEGIVFRKADIVEFEVRPLLERFDKFMITTKPS